jgi:radical SAM family uncharacterized protein/radical SAM-linked protein
VNIENNLQNFLHLVQKPSRYTGGELNLCAKDPEKVAIKVALAFPEVYEIGMSHLGIKILYHVINSLDYALADRVFSPWIDMEAQMKQRGLPLWGLETKLPLHDFDVVGFSLMHELLYTNVLTILDLGNIPLKSADRTESDPLVIAGGPCVTNPEPMAAFIDAFIIGEAEEIIVDIIDLFVDAKKGGISREETLFGLAGTKGVYVPAFYRPVYSKTGNYTGLEPVETGVPDRIQRQWPKTLKNSAYPKRPIVPLTRIVQDRLDVELFRGCTRGCRFCHAGFFYRPVRERSLKDIVNQVRQGLLYSGWDEFGLLSLSSSDYTNIEAVVSSLKEELLQKKVSCSLPSLRADNFSLDLAEMVSEIKKTGLTFAPEAGTDRLRRVINKEIDKQEILDTTRTAFSEGWNLIKCYFMVGLPTERDDDISGLVDLALSIYDIAKSAGRNNRLNVSVGSFVPKPHTPFQWEAFCPPVDLKAKILTIRQRLTARGIKVKWHSVEASKLEAMLSRGGREMARAVEEAWNLGCRFDEWTERQNPKRWEEAIHRCGLEEKALLAERNEHDVLPWDHIDIQVEKNHLIQERHLALKSKTTEDCRWSSCHGCGIPGSPQDIVLAKKETPCNINKVPRDLADQTQQSATTRYRLALQKNRPVRFVSHLDTTQILIRTLRILDLPVFYTQGLSPRPKVSSGPPLPTGVIGKEEIFDIFFARHEERDIATLMNRVLPKGLLVSRATRIPLNSPSPSSLLTWGNYIVTFPTNTLHVKKDVSEIIAAFDKSSVIPVEVERKGKSRSVDLKKAIADISIVSPSPLSISFMSKVLDPGGNTCSPFLLLRSLFGFNEEDIATTTIIRERLLTLDLRPLPTDAACDPGSG